MKRLNLLAGYLVVLCVLLSSCATASFSKYKGVGRVKRYDFYSVQLPDSFDGFRVAFASDFHYESRFTARRLPGMCQALRSLDADVLLLGGDYRGRNGGDVTQLFQALKTVAPPCGTYAVMGNHERGQADSLARKVMQATGVHLLEHEVDTLWRGKEYILLCGIRNPFDLKRNGGSPPFGIAGRRFRADVGAYTRLCGGCECGAHRFGTGRTYARGTSQFVPPMDTGAFFQIRQPFPDRVEV